MTTRRLVALAVALWVTAAAVWVGIALEVRRAGLVGGVL